MRNVPDVVVMGRSGVDIHPVQTGVGLEDVETSPDDDVATAVDTAVSPVH